MTKCNFDALMLKNPTVHQEFTNSQGHKVQLCEHPLRGDEAPVIVVFPEMKLAFHSDFYDCDDMLDVGGEYEPVLTADLDCVCGFELI